MLTPKDAWLATLGQLELQLNRATFDTWLRGAELLAYEEAVFTVRVPHAYAKDWLEKHLVQDITKTLSAIFQQTATINFVAQVPQRTPPAAPPGPLFDALPLAADGPSETLTAAQAAIFQPVPPPPAQAPTAEVAPRSDYSEWDPRVSDVRTRPAVSATDLPAAGLTQFDRRYTFDSFVCGPCNTFAAAAAKAVAAAPGQSYNPLYIYGGVGCGKTHLLHAVGCACQRAGRLVLYVSAEAFTNELVAAIRDKKTEELRDRYRKVDVLLLDDAQFLAGRTSSAEEFLHTFNAIFSLSGQIVVAASAHPRLVEKLDDRLRSRFEGGLLADIQTPDLSTRLTILQQKARTQGIPLPEDVATTLARHDTHNVRELEGLLTQVLARATLTQQTLSATLAEQILNKNSVEPVRRRGTNIAQVIQATATYHQLSMDDLLSKRRTKDVVRARQIAMYLAREETDASLPQIGEALGGRNHSTVLHGYQKIAGTVDEDDVLRREIGDIRRQLYLYAN